MASRTPPPRLPPSIPALQPALRVRDLRKTLARLCEFIALGLAAASVFMKFPNDLNRPNSPLISQDNLPTLSQQLAFIASHTRAMWVTMGVISLLIAVLGYRARRSAKPNRLVLFAPVLILLVIALHTTAQACLQSQSPLKIESRGSIIINPLDPATRTPTISHITVMEGTAAQWQLLFAGDLLFATPLLFAWVLNFTRPATG
jgi:hypothetical protein